MALTLSVLPDRFAICHMSSDAVLPDWALAPPFAAAVRTADELSLVCVEALVPQQVQAERGWRAIKVQGPLDFALTGVLSSLAAPLAQARISIFAISTFETDYLLVKEATLERALAVLSHAGHRIARAG
ncbi:MAG: ACT domain-containing protein [Chloroflexi bacterium]|jgi:hypothetical protein|nr:ACT domain-containing protein [Chloroflexota bacterium]